MDEQNKTDRTDPFTTMWADMMGRMAGMQPPAAAPPDMLEPMRRAFFDAMTKSADEYMRSEQFLTMMKQGMDNALAFRQQLNQFLKQNLQAAQMPTRADTDHMVLLVRGMEERVLEKLDELNRRIEGLESHQNGNSRGRTEESKPKSVRGK